MRLRVFEGYASITEGSAPVAVPFRRQRDVLDSIVLRFVGPTRKGESHSENPLLSPILACDVANSLVGHQLRNHACLNPHGIRTSANLK